METIVVTTVDGSRLIDFEKSFSDEYIVDLEESFEARIYTTEGPEWYFQIFGKYGHICPHSDTELGVATNNNGKKASQIASLPFVRVSQRGSDGVNAVFPTKHLSQIADIVWFCRKRRLTPEQRSAKREILARNRDKATVKRINQAV